MKNLNELDSILKENENIIGYDYTKETNAIRIFTNTKETYTELSEELKEFPNVTILRGNRKNGRK